MMGYDWSGPGAGAWLMFAALLVAGAIVLVVWLVVRAARVDPASAAQTPSRAPMEILRDRLARGEITELEFKQLQQTIGPDR